MSVESWRDAVVIATEKQNRTDYAFGCQEIQ